MDNHCASVPIFRLKVNLKCCAACPNKAEKKLKKIHGVKSITVDKEKGLVIVSGNVDLKVLIDRFAKWGRKAQLLSPFQSDLASSAQHLKIAKDFSNDSDDDDDDDDCHCDEATKKQNSSVSWEHASLINKEPKIENPDIIITNKQKLINAKTIKGKFAWFWNLFRRKKSSSESNRLRSPTTIRGTNADGTGRYPRPRWPSNNNNNNNKINTNRSSFEHPSYGGLPPRSSYNFPYFPRSYPPPPPPPPPLPPPYGMYGSRPPWNHPQTIHYTSYRDNYFPDPMY